MTRNDQDMTGTRLYLITPSRIDDVSKFEEQLLRVLDAASGTTAEVRCVQLRLKNTPDTAILAVAEKLLPIVHSAGSILLINDRPDLAHKAGADGVHLGQSDTPLDQARTMLGEEASIGVTCHNSRHLAMLAGETGADYVAFGAFYPTQTKPVRFHATPALITWWVQATTLPCVAIGGISASNAAPLITAGADFLAVSSAIWDDPAGPVAGINAFAAIL